MQWVFVQDSKPKILRNFLTHKHYHCLELQTFIRKVVIKIFLWKIKMFQVTVEDIYDGAS